MSSPALKNRNMACADTQTFKSKSITKQPSNRIYFSIYCILYAVNGFTLAFPGAVFLELQKNLNASTFTMSWIYSMMGIGYMVASAPCGYVADHMKELHRVHAPTILVHSLCVLFVPYCTNVTAMFVTFTLIGIGLAAIQTNEILLTFRLFPMSHSKMITWCCIVSVVFGALTPLLFEVSMDNFGSPKYPFIIFGIVGIIHSILVLFLKTPQHDALRSLKRSVTKIGIGKQIHQSLNEDRLGTPDFHNDNLDLLAKSAASQLHKTGNYKTLQIVTIILLMLVMMVEGCVIRGYLSFIGPYCVDYLGIHESWSRYYIVCIYASYAGYRTFQCILFPNFSSIVQVTASSVLRLVSAVAFVFYAKDVVSLFVVYIMIGLSGAPIVPSLLAWAESITPTTGIISCSWWIFSGIGDSAMSFTLGSLIEKYGAQIMPVAVAVSLGFALIINVCAVVTSKVLQQRQARVFAETVANLTVYHSCDGGIECTESKTKSPIPKLTN